MEPSPFPPLATDTFDKDHVFLRLTQELNGKKVNHFHLLDPVALCSTVESWAGPAQKVYYVVKQNLSLEDEMQQQDCRYFLLRFEKPIAETKPVQLTFRTKEGILNRCDILDIELQERPWMLFEALFGNCLIRVYPRDFWRNSDGIQELPLHVVALPNGEYTYYLNQSEPEGAEKAEIDLWVTLKNGCDDLLHQEELLEKIEPQIRRFLCKQEETMDMNQAQLKVTKELVQQQQLECFKSETTFQKACETFDLLKSEKLKTITNNWDDKEKFEFNSYLKKQ